MSSTVTRIIEQNRLESGCATKCDRDKCRVLSTEYAKLADSLKDQAERIQELEAENARLKGAAV